MIETDAVFDPKGVVSIVGQSGFGGRFMAILGGIALCFTGIGALVGIPLLLWGLFSKTYVIGAHCGTCPKCAIDLQIALGSPAADCPVCKARVIVAGDKFRVLG